MWNFGKIAESLTLMLQTTDDETLSIQATGNEKNQDVPTSAGAGRDASSNAEGGRSIKNLWIDAKLAKSKKPNFAKTNSGTDFLTSGAKETFIHLWKTFTKAQIVRHFDPERHIRIKADASGYAISGILSQMTSNYLDQLIFNYVTHKNLNPITLKSKIGQ